VRDGVSCHMMAAHRRDQRLHRSLLPLVEDAMCRFEVLVVVGGTALPELLVAKHVSGIGHQ
jgi:hypothetical protein